MSTYRIYPIANSVVFSSDLSRNVGKNQVFELWYGVSGITRAVFKWDWQQYYDHYQNGWVPPLTSSSVQSLTTNFTCTYPIRDSGQTVGTASYELEYQNNGNFVDFEEGLGWWHEGNDTLTGFSNWINATEATPWPNSGIASNSILTAITTIARDSEILSFSPTNMSLVSEELWSGAIVPNQYAITLFKFTDDYEALTGSPIRKRLFYSRHTNTPHLPYIEIKWDDRITEDRANIIEQKSSPLYLFTYKNGRLEDPAVVNSVTIGGVVFTGISHISRGIYRFDYTLPIGSGNTGTQLNDIWNVTWEGSLNTNITQTFTGVSVEYSSTYTPPNVSGQKYYVALANLEDEYRTGDTMYIRVKFKKEFSRSYEVNKNAEYRIYMVNGDTDEPQLTMIDWTPMSYRNNENFFIVNLSWFIVNQEYKIDVRYSDGNSQIINSINRKFKVIA